MLVKDYSNCGSSAKEKVGSSYCSDEGLVNLVDMGVTEEVMLGMLAAVKTDSTSMGF